MNDPDIDDALEVGLSSCLRSLQRSNPELLLTANQLKRTERDVRYLPAIAASLASIVKNSSDAEFRSDVYGKVMSWQRDKADEESEGKSNDFSFELDAMDISPKASRDIEQRNNGDDNSSSSSKSSSLDSEEVMNESMDRLSAMRLSSLIEHRLRYCISDENKERKKEEERKRKLEARREEKARKEKAKQKQKQDKKRRPAGKSKKPMFRSGDVSDGDNSNIDLDDLLLEDESEEMGYSQDSDDSSVMERRKRASRIRDLAFIDSDDESSTGSTSSKSSKSSSHCQSKRNGSDERGMEEKIDGDQLGEESDFSEDESILRPSEDVVPQKVEAHRSRLRNEEEEEKKDDGFGDGFEDDDDDDDWL